MYTKLLTGFMASGLIFASGAMAAEKPHKSSGSSDMQRAIAWERFKDEAAARQARKEVRNPSVSYDANRSANRSTDEPKGSTVKDPGPPAYRNRDKK